MTRDVVEQSASMTRELLKKPVRTTERVKVLVTVLAQTGEGASGQVMDKTVRNVTVKVVRAQS